jgi:hypothetical protein
MFPPFGYGTDKAETIPTEQLQKVSPDGTYAFRGDIFGKYGGYANDSLRKKPEIIKVIKKAKKAFKPKDVGTSFPTKVFQLSDGRTMILLRGCTPHNCGGTENVIAFDYQNQKAYILAENQDQGTVTIYGNPDQLVKKVLIFQYLDH